MGLLQQIAKFDLDSLKNKQALDLYFLICAWKQQAQRELQLQRIEGKSRTRMSRLKSQYKQQLKELMQKV